MQALTQKIYSIIYFIDFLVYVLNYYYSSLTCI